jgi:GTP cyclohydrolase I
MPKTANTIEDVIRQLLRFVGEDPDRGGLLETPARVAKAWKFWCKGYAEDPAALFKTFDDGAEGTSEMVVVKDIPFYTHCEHHLAPFFGTATIGYLPDKKIVGLSKISRVLDVFARRLQVQERLTTQVADTIMENLTPLGVGVVIKARHLCMESRGVCQQGHHTVTCALRGTFRDDPKTRAEFMQLTQS